MGLGNRVRRVVGECFNTANLLIPSLPHGRGSDTPGKLCDIAREKPSRDREGVFSELYEILNSMTGIKNNSLLLKIYTSFFLF